MRGEERKGEETRALNIHMWHGASMMHKNPVENDHQ